MKHRFRNERGLMVLQIYARCPTRYPKAPGTYMGWRDATLEDLTDGVLLDDSPRYTITDKGREMRGGGA
jgi:hypothetical protein